MGLTVITKAPNPRDTAVGHRIRAYRLERNMSQQALGDHLGISFQQVQKYEKGANRVSAGRLEQIAEIFDLPVTAFYATGEGAEGSADTLLGLLDTAAAMRMLRAYSRISDRTIQQALVALVERIADRD